MFAVKIVNNDSVVNLIDMISALRTSPEGYYTIHFHLSDLLEQYKSDYQIKIAINILNDLFKGYDGVIFFMPNKDLVLLYHGGDRGLLEKSIFQLRYLFMDDPLSYTNDGFENPDFCSVYDLEFQWRELFRTCRQIYTSEKVEPEVKDKDSKVSNNVTNSIDSSPRHIFTPIELNKIINQLEKINIEAIIESQPICAFSERNKVPRPLYSETYIHIAALRELLKVNVDLLSNNSLFKYLTYTLDKKILGHFVEKNNKLKPPFCLNVNVKTLTSDLFQQLDKKIKPADKKSIIFEIHVSDVFEDIHKFMVVRDELSKLGYQFCLDGLDNVSIKHVNPTALGFNLTKLQWNPEMNKENDSKELTELADTIKILGANRIILCRCDNDDAIKYGRSLGISLFQGWHIDSLLAYAKVGIK